ncbi:MAG TPA: biotin/lipoyl-containing protein [Actinomycetota bacterium]|nr:biotin/lipoyl-containing protein [Actinomycetota bacterium]
MLLGLGASVNASEIALLATEAATSGGEGVFVKGIAITIAFIVVFVGSVWLLTSMILGAKLGYYVTGACLFAVMTLLSLIWFVTALGPRGEAGFWGDLGTDTAWHSVSVGPDPGEVESRWGSWDLSDYPDGEGWVDPEDDVQLADLEGEGVLASELENANPVMEALVMEAVSPIPGIVESVEDQVTGDIALDPENFAVTDIKMKEVDVAGKESVIAAGRAVPIEQVQSGDLGGKAEGTVTEFLVEEGTPVTPGMPLMEVEADGETITLNADKAGTLVEYGFRIDDLIKPAVPFATLDMTGQPGAPADAVVSSVRVRGSVRVPAFIYLVVSFVLLILHLIGVSKIEKEARLSQPQLA